MPTIQDALSALLLALGFEAMAKGVLTETDRDRMMRYARVVLKNAPADARAEITPRLRIAGLL